MNTQQAPLPLRVPELGPSLGKLVTGTGRVFREFSLDANRCDLATRVMEMAGEARRLAANDERSAALGTLGRNGWMTAWEETVGAATAKLVNYLTIHLDAEAVAVGMPKRDRQRVLIDETESRALGVRLGSAGADLIPFLDQIEAEGVTLQEATRSERDALESWQRAQTAAARSLEAAWLELEDRVDQEFATWRAVADEIARWRKPLWPVVVTGIIGLLGAVWGGALLGGFVAPPDWLRGLWRSIRAL